MKRIVDPTNAQPVAIPIDPSTAIDMPTGAERADRLTVIAHLHHEQVGEQPVSILCNFAALLEHKVQAMHRKLKIGKEPHALAFGWIDPKESGQIVIENRIGAGFTKLPTKEERESIAKSLVYVRVSSDSPPLIVRPGRFVFFEPSDPQQVLVWAEEEQTPINLHIFPR